MTHKRNSTTLRCTAEERNFSAHLLNLLGILETSTPSRSADGFSVVIKIFDDPNQTTFIDFDNVPIPDLESYQMTGAKVHNRFTHNRVRLFVGGRYRGCGDPMLMNIDTQHHCDDIEFLPKSRAKVRRKIKERFSYTSTNEFAVVLVGESTGLFKAVLGEHVSSFFGVLWDLNFMNTKVDRIICVMHCEANFDEGFIFEDTGRQPEIHFLS